MLVVVVITQGSSDCGSGLIILCLEVNCPAKYINLQLSRMMVQQSGGYRPLDQLLKFLKRVSLKFNPHVAPVIPCQLTQRFWQELKIK